MIDPREEQARMQCQVQPQAQYKIRALNLSVQQKIMLKPALTFIQLGASLYLMEFVKPYMPQIMVASFLAVGLILFQAIRDQF